MPFDLTNPIELHVSQAVLAIETNDARFEAFCREVVSCIEGGATIFSTSASWDLGRDGVGAGVARGIYVCTSLRDDVDAKVLSDLERVTSTTTGITRIYFCSSHQLSEHKRTQLETQLAAEIDNAFPVTCLGSTQLTEAVAHEPAIIERKYGPEIRNALRAISADPADETEVRGLRLALMATSGEDSIQIRQELYAGGLLDMLSDRKPRTISVCAKSLSEKLRLGRLISDAAVLPHLKRLHSEGFFSQNDGVFSITDAGIKRAQELNTQAVDRFLSGRHAIRQAIENSIGEKIIDDHFHQIWAIFEDRITFHFHERGEALVAEISALVEESSELSSPRTTTHLSFLNELATAVANTATHPNRRSELNQAVTDLFTDRTSVATDWLVRVCASYLACTALGLEHSSSAAIGRLFARTTLVLDTDVALSLLCAGEPEHSSVITFVSQWPKLGGKLLVAEPVLEEIAYHASIAQHDFDQVKGLIPGTREDRIRLIENAFVRAFAEHLAENTISLSHWGRFIAHFKGTMPYDWERIAGYLKAEHAVDKMPSRTATFEGLESEVRHYLIQSANQQGYHGKTVGDKAKRDARLYTDMVSYLKTLRATDPGATCLLVSSAHRLLETEKKFRESGEQQLVVPISTVLYLLSLLPQVSLGISAMKTFLFEERRPGFSSDLERSILRMVRMSRQVALPWAKRGILIKEVRNKLLDDAKKEGHRPRDDANTHALEQSALRPENSARTIELLSEALDKIAVGTRTEDENARLRRENEALKKQLEAVRVTKTKLMKRR